MKSLKIDMTSQRFGLPDSLLVPIAARNIGAIERFVGRIDEQITGRSDRLNAIAVVPHEWPVKKDLHISLWNHSNAQEYEMRLHPPRQVWVHVDYSGYRRAYIKMGMPEIPGDYVLDHIQNREAVRMLDYSHPYLRLCPVSHQVNTSGGASTGSEGMAKEHIRTLDSQPDSIKKAVREAFQCDIIYADPTDLTKMLNIPPGTKVLDGVRNMLRLFYPV